MGLIFRSGTDQRLALGYLVYTYNKELIFNRETDSLEGKNVLRGFKWLVEKIKLTKTGVDLTLTLQVVDNKTVHPVEYRRKQLHEPHSAIKTEIPTSWITEV